MNTIKSLFFFTLLFALSPTLSFSAEYFTDEKKLSDEMQAEYIVIYNFYQHPDFAYDVMLEMGVRIDSFTHIEPMFLPIYMEKVRHLIMLGYTIAKFQEYNLKALNIVKDINMKAPKYAKAYVQGANISLHLARLEDAYNYLKKAESLDKLDPWLYGIWAQYFEKRNSVELALKYVTKMILVSKDDEAAMHGAIDLLARYTGMLEKQINANEVVKIIFSNFHTVESRVGIAGGLVDTYSGNRLHLTIAESILKKQISLTPNYAKLYLVMANLELTMGFKVANDYRMVYEKTSIQKALSILQKISNDAEVINEVSLLQFDILVSQKKYIDAEKHLHKSKTSGLTENEFLRKLAFLRYHQGKYSETIRIYEDLAQSDLTVNAIPVFAAAYFKIGDEEKLNQYYLRSVSKNPSSAWENGNYATFLLQNMNDYDGAIKYGERALSIMEYPIARNVTALAYVLKAAELYKNGDKSNAIKYYSAHKKFGVSERYINKNCKNYCIEIREMRSVFSGKVI